MDIVKDAKAKHRLENFSFHNKYSSDVALHTAPLAIRAANSGSARARAKKTQAEAAPFPGRPSCG